METELQTLLFKRVNNNYARKSNLLVGCINYTRNFYKYRVGILRSINSIETKSTFTNPGYIVMP